MGGRATIGVNTGTRSKIIFQDKDSRTKVTGEEEKGHVPRHKRGGRKRKVDLLRAFSDKGGPEEKNWRQATKLFKCVSIHLFTYHSRGQPINRVSEFSLFKHVLGTEEKIR